MTIKEARKKAGLSQESCARHMNISHVSFNHKEQGKSKWTYEQVKCFCTLVGCSIEDIEDFR